MNRIAGFYGALIPVIVTLISYEGLQQLLAQFSSTITQSAEAAGLGQIAVTVVAGILGAIGSGILAYYKSVKEVPQIAARGTFVPPSKNAFLYGS